MTIAAAVWLAWYMGWRTSYTIVGAFALGALVHLAFGVNTTANVFLFGRVE
jgi:sulfite exporter TauE/SafE